MEGFPWNLEDYDRTGSAEENMKEDYMDSSEEENIEDDDVYSSDNEDMKDKDMDSSEEEDMMDDDMDSSEEDENIQNVAMIVNINKDKPNPQDVVIEVSNPDAISPEEKQQGEVQTVSRTKAPIEVTLEEDHPPIIINGQHTEENIFYMKDIDVSPLQNSNNYDQLYDSTVDSNSSSVTYALDKNKKNRDIDGITKQGDNIGSVFDKIVNNIFQDNKRTQERVFNLRVNHENLENPAEDIINTYDSGSGYNIIMREEHKDKNNLQENVINLYVNPQHLEHPPPVINTYDSVSDGNRVMGLKAKANSNLNNHINSDDIKCDILQDLFPDIEQTHETVFNIHESPEHSEHPPQEIEADNSVKCSNIDMGLEAIDKSNSNNYLESEEVPEDVREYLFHDSKQSQKDALVHYVNNKNLIDDTNKDILQNGTLAEEILINSDKNTEHSVIRTGNNVVIVGYSELDIYLRNNDHQEELEDIMPTIDVFQEDLVDITHNSDEQLRNEANDDEIQIFKQIAPKKTSNKRTKRNKNSLILNEQTNRDTNDPASANVKWRLNTICVVCGDKAKGYNYDAPTCEGCKRFFRLSVENKRKYQDECKTNENCVIYIETRTNCRLCRLNKCIKMGMKKELVGIVLKQRKEKVTNQNKVAKGLETNLVASSTVKPRISASLSAKIPKRRNTKVLAAQTDVPRTECMFCGKKGIDKKSIRSHERTMKCYRNRLPEYAHLPPLPPPTQKRNRKRKATEEPEIVIVGGRPKISLT